MEESKQFYSIPEIAKRWGIHRKLVYQEVSSGRLKAMKIGNKVLRVSAKELTGYEANQLADAA